MNSPIQITLIKTLMMICLIFFISNAAKLTAQNKRVDSLKMVLKKAKNDTMRCNALNLLITAEENNGKEWLTYNTEMMNICIKNINDKHISHTKYLTFKKYEVIALNNEAYQNQLHGNTKKALEQFLNCLKIDEEMKNSSGIAFTYNNIGRAYQELGDHKNAMEYFSKSLDISKMINDRALMAFSFNSIGLEYHIMGDLSKAIEYYSNSISLREEINDLKGSANSLSNLAMIYQNMGDLTRSSEYLQKGFKMRSSINDKEGMAGSLSNLGLIYHEKGDINNALQCYNESLRLFSELNIKRGIAINLTNIGLLYKGLGEIPLAMDHLKKSLEIFEEIDSKTNMAQTMMSIGLMYRQTPEKALEFLNRALKIQEEAKDKKGTAITLNNLGSTYLRKFLFRTIKNDFEMARHFCTKSLMVSMESGFIDLQRNAMVNLYKLYCRSRSLDTAKTYLNSFMNVNNKKLDLNYYTLSEKEKEFYFSLLEKDYTLYYDFTEHYKNTFPNLTDTSYNIALQNKGLTLKSSTAIRNTILNSGDTALIREYEDWRSSKKKIAKLFESGKDIKELENKVNDQETELVKRSGAFADLVMVKNLDWKKVQKGLKKGEAAIEFVHFNSEIDTTYPIVYAALIIRPESIHPEMRSLCMEKDLIKILNTFSGDNIGSVNKIYGTKKEAQIALYEKIWKPMEGILKGIKTVYYSPSGLLHKVSFAAINTGKDHFICDNYNLNRMGSTGKITTPSNINYTIEDECLLVGGVNYNTDVTKNRLWDYLPGTLSEAQDIYNLLKENGLHEHIYTSANASEENLKNNISKATILHISTHGFFFPDPEIEKEKQSKENERKHSEDSSMRSPSSLVINEANVNVAHRGSTNYANWSFVNNKNPLMRSGLVLAGANDVWDRDPLKEGEDGILTAAEVANLDLQKTKLVVLSACETGLGDIKGSEGVYGLQRAFKMAGAKYIIMSLWQVPDVETSEFMVNFYKKLVASKDIKKAFNETQREMRKKYDPYFWAAFTLLE